MTTNANNDAIPSGLELLSTVAKTWWAFPNATAPNVSGAPVQQFTDFASDLQRIYADTFNRHRDLLFQEMTELSGRAPALLRVDQPQDAVEEPRKVLASLFEASSQRAKIWTDMSRQVGARYAALAHQLAHDIDQTSDETPKATPAAKSKKRVE